MLHLDRTDAPAASEYATVYLVFELSKAKWKLGVMLPGSQKMSRFTIAGGDETAPTARLTAICSKACQGGPPVRILACYEAGLSMLPCTISPSFANDHSGKPSNRQRSGRRARWSRRLRPHHSTN